MAEAWKEEEEAADDEEARERGGGGERRRAGHMYTRGGDLHDGKIGKE